MASLFVRSRPTTNWAANTVYALGDRRKATAAVLGKHFECTTAGTSHATTEPTWDTAVGNTTADGTLTWTCRGSANTWVASTAYILGDRVVATTAASAADQSYVYDCTTAGNSGNAEPDWVTTTVDSSTTTDNAGGGTAVWTLRKPSTWNNAHIKLEKLTGDAAGTGKAVPGDTVYVGDEHVQTQASALSFDWLTSRTNPYNVICVNDTGDPATPTTLANTAAVQTTGANAISIANTANNGVYYYGIKFQAGDGASNASIIMANASAHVVFENCLLEVRGTSSSSGIVFGGTSATSIFLINTPVKFAAVGHGFKGLGFTWLNTANAVQGTAPTTLFPSSNSASNPFRISGVDLSAVTGNLISVAGTNAGNTFLISNCKLAVGVTLVAGASAGLGRVTVKMVNCDSGATNTNLYFNDARGVIDEELTIVRSGGASDGISPISWKMATVATVARFSMPMPSFPITLWNDTTGSSKTLTVEIVHDSVTNLKDDEILG